MPNKKRMSKEEMRKAVGVASRYAGKRKAAPKKPDKKISWVSKLKASVKSYFKKEKKKQYNIRTKAISRVARDAGVTSKELDKFRSKK